MGKEVRQEDIAKALGVSIVTVSRALADKEGVGQGLKKQILDMAKNMGYTPKAVRQETNVTATVAILIAEEYLQVEHSFFTAMQLHVSHSLTKLGVSSLLKILGEDALFVLKNMPDFVGGIVVVGKLPPNLLRFCEQLDISLVYLDFYVPESRAISVIADGYLGAWETTRYLLEAGHSDIGYVGSIREDNNAEDRYFGYCKALGEKGISPKEEWVLHNRASKGFLEEYQLPQTMPTAFVCDCDQSAAIFVRDLSRKGYRVPEDVSVTGFYNHVFSSLSTPPLTTYHIDMAEMGRQAATAITQDMLGVSVSKRIVISGEIYQRDSVKKLIN